MGTPGAAGGLAGLVPSSDDTAREPLIDMLLSNIY
jgi:hypothetical protein